MVGHKRFLVNGYDATTTIACVMIQGNDMSKNISGCNNFASLNMRKTCIEQVGEMN